MVKVFNIFCPNKHRVAVQAEDNKTLLQIFDEFCKKKGYPLNSYGLTFQGRMVDLSQTVRRSNLPNNCLLEMVESTIKISAEVDIALQLPDGVPRQVISCSPESSLFEMLQKFDEVHNSCVNLKSLDEPLRTPVIQYLNDEIVGQAALSAKTLKKLGIISGRTLLRFLFRSVTSDQLSVAAKLAEEELAKERRLDAEFKDKLEANVDQKKSAVNVDSSTSYMTPPSRSQPVGIPFHQMSVATPETPCNTPVVPSMLANNNTAVRLSQLHQTLQALDQNLDGNVPLSPDFIQANRVLSDTVNQAQMVQDFIMSGRSGLGPVVFGRQVNVAQHHHQQPPPLMPFKFPEETRGQNLREADMEDQSETVEPCDRQLVVFRLDEKMDVSGSGAPVEDLSEKDFELTPEDLQLQHRRLKEMAGYTTSTKENKARMRRAYVYSVIRFLLPDGHVVQGNFKSLEAVAVLYDFIKGLLVDPSVSFTLVMPPNQALSKLKENLLDASVAPKSSLRVRFGGDFQLNPVVLQQLEGIQKADEILHVCLSMNGTYEPSLVALGSGLMGETKPTTEESSMRPARHPESANMPKWMKKPKAI